MSRTQSIRRVGGFSLLEILVSVAVVGGVLLVITSAMATMQNTYVRTRARMDIYRSAHSAMETISRRVTMATLDARWQVPPQSAESTDPDYERESDLHFYCGPVQGLPGISGDESGHAVFFQAPLGIDDVMADDNSQMRHERLSQALNAWGYFVELHSDASQRPDFMAEAGLARSPRLRFRLMEFRQPTDELSVFRAQPADPFGKPAISFGTSRQAVLSYTENAFMTDNEQRSRTSVVAENIVAFLIRPVSGGTDPGNQNLQRYALAPDMTYDTRAFQYASTPINRLTRHVLPPAVEITLVAVAEEAWDRLGPQQAPFMMQQIKSMVDNSFADFSSFDSNLQTLQRFLNQNKIEHRVLVQTVPLPEGRRPETRTATP